MNPTEEDINEKKPNIELKSLLQQAKEQFELDKELKNSFSEPIIMEEKNLEKIEKIPSPEDQLKLAVEIKQYEEEVQKAKEEIKEFKKEDPVLEMLIKEQKQIKKEAEQKLLMKKKELEIMTRMDMKTVNKLLLTEDLAMISQHKELIENLKKAEEEEIKEKNNEKKKIISYENLPKRLPNSVKENYKKEKKEFYNPVTDREINALHEEIRKNKENMNKSKNVDDYEALNEQYYKKYHSFLQSQPKVEQTRQEIINNMALAHEMMSSLKNPGNLNSIKIWNPQPLPQKEAEEIRKYIERKELLMKNKWRLDLEVPPKRDVCKEVDDYLEEKLAKYAEKYKL